MCLSWYDQWFSLVVVCSGNGERKWTNTCLVWWQVCVTWLNAALLSFKGLHLLIGCCFDNNRHPPSLGSPSWENRYNMWQVCGKSWDSQQIQGFVHWLQSENKRPNRPHLISSIVDHFAPHPPYHKCRPHQLIYPSCHISIPPLWITWDISGWPSWVELSHTEALLIRLRPVPSHTRL